jgi:hypothetical protein
MANWLPAAEQDAAMNVDYSGGVIVVAILHLRRDPNWIQHLMQQR